MKKTLFSFIAALGLLAISQSASAQTDTPPSAATTVTIPAAAPTATPAATSATPNSRQANQRARIKQGVASGELTRNEAARLKARQVDIRQGKQAARADGVVTRDERQDIRKDQARSSKAIYRQKHDAQDRPRANR